MACMTHHSFPKQKPFCATSACTTIPSLASEMAPRLQEQPEQPTAEVRWRLLPKMLGAVVRIGCPKNNCAKYARPISKLQL